MRIAILSTLFILCNNLLSAQSIDKLTESQWKDDIEFLREKIYKTVPEAEERIDKAAFEQKSEQLINDLSMLSTEEIVVGLEELLALSNDNGCYLYPFQPVLDFPVLPIKGYWFSDGLYVCDAAEEYKELIGQRLFSINGTNVEEAFGRMKRSLPADNESYQRYMFPMYSQIPAWQKGAGFSADNGESTLSTANGQDVKVAFAPVKEYMPLKRSLASQNKLSGSTNDHSGENYWMEYIPEKNTLFLQFNFIGDDEKGPSFKDFVKSIEKELNSGKVEILAIDNRYGGGGNGFKLKSLTDLIRDLKINQTGKIFILTGRATRGTVLEMTSVLSLTTKAKLVGEPTGEGPNLVGDTKSVSLPNSGISVNLTHIFWPTSWEEDKRRTIEPSLPVAYSYSDYKQGKDPWLEAIWSYEPDETARKPVEKNLADALVGKHDLAGRTLEIEKRGESLFVSMERKIRSFFELNTELYLESEGVLSCDIPDVYFYFSNEKGKTTLLKVDWMGTELK